MQVCVCMGVYMHVHSIVATVHIKCLSNEVVMKMYSECVHACCNFITCSYSIWLLWLPMGCVVPTAVELSPNITPLNALTRTL